MFNVYVIIYELMDKVVQQADSQEDQFSSKESNSHAFSNSGIEYMYQQNE